VFERKEEQTQTSWEEEEKDTVTSGCSLSLSPSLSFSPPHPRFLICLPLYSVILCFSGFISFHLSVRLATPLLFFKFLCFIFGSFKSSKVIRFICLLRTIISSWHFTLFFFPQISQVCVDTSGRLAESQSAELEEEHFVRSGGIFDWRCHRRQILLIP
jgi:hypothetical protein